jgi:hypothetical protein
MIHAPPPEAKHADDDDPHKHGAHERKRRRRVNVEYNAKHEHGDQDQQQSQPLGPRVPGGATHEACILSEMCHRKIVKNSGLWVLKKKSDGALRGKAIRILGAPVSTQLPKCRGLDPQQLLRFGANFVEDNLRNQS